MSTVEISEETARTALRELRATITRTGGSEAEHPCTAIAEGIHRIEKHAHVSGTDEDTAIKILKEVAKERGIEYKDTDPLTDGVFTAAKKLEEALAPGPDDVEISNGDVFQTPNGPVEIVSTSPPGQLEVTDPTITHPQNSRAETWAIAEQEFRVGIVDGEIQPATLEVNVISDESSTHE